MPSREREKVVTTTSPSPLQAASTKQGAEAKEEQSFNSK